MASHCKNEWDLLWCGVGFFCYDSITIRPEQFLTERMIIVEKGDTFPIRVVAWVKEHGKGWAMDQIVENNDLTVALSFMRDHDPALKHIRPVIHLED